MKPNMLNPFVRFARIFKENPMSEPFERICYDSRIFFFSNVSGRVVLGKEKYNISDKTAIFFPPGTKYLFDISFFENSSIIILNFDFDYKYSHIDKPISPAESESFDKEKILGYELSDELSKPVIKALPKIEGMLLKCTDNFIIKNEYYRENSSALVKLSLLEFIKKEAGGLSCEVCKKALEYIRENFTNPALTNEEIAEVLNYHPYYLSSLIKNETGKTLHQFLIYYRLQMAKDMLTTTDYDISEIAYRSGFETSAYFAKMFHKNEGQTPKEYRNNHRKNGF